LKNWDETKTFRAMVVNRRRLVISAFLLVSMLGAGLRFFRLANQSFWTDEISSITTARVPLGEIAERSASLNNSLPTYFLLLRAVIGDSNRNIEFRARSLSALCGSLSVPVFIGVVYLWQRRWGAALLGGLLLAINPLHLWYSQEVRAYAVMLFFGLVALLACELAQGSRGSSGVMWWLIYLLASVTTAAMHKTGLVFPLACGLWQAWGVLRRRARIETLWVHGAVRYGVYQNAPRDVVSTIVRHGISGNDACYMWHTYQEVVRCRRNIPPNDLCIC